MRLSPTTADRLIELALASRAALDAGDNDLTDDLLRDLHSVAEAAARDAGVDPTAVWWPLAFATANALAEADQDPTAAQPLLRRAASRITGRAA